MVLCSCSLFSSRFGVLRCFSDHCVCKEGLFDFMSACHVMPLPSSAELDVLFVCLKKIRSFTDKIFFILMLDANVNGNLYCLRIADVIG